MKELKLSTKGAELIKFYEIMATEGFHKTDGTKVPAEFAYNSFQLKKI